MSGERTTTEILAALGNADVVAPNAVGSVVTANELLRVGWSVNAEGCWLRQKPASKSAPFPSNALNPKTGQNLARCLPEETRGRL